MYSFLNPHETRHRYHTHCVNISGNEGAGDSKINPVGLRID
jgi:hypothetical protein